MPRNHRLPAPRPHKASGQTVITLGGRDFYCGPIGSEESQQEALRLLGLWLAAGQPAGGPPGLDQPTARVITIPGSDLEPEGLLVDELILQYLAYAEGYYRDPEGNLTREPETMQLAFRPLIQLYAGTAAVDFGPRALKTVRDLMVQEDLCRREINKRIGYIQRLFRWGSEEELIPPAHYHGLKSIQSLKANRSPARESEPVTPVADEDVQKTLPYLPPVLQAMVQIQRLTGMRPGELVIMKPENVDRRADVWIYQPGRHKTRYLGHQRFVPLGPKTRVLLEPYLAGTAPTGFIFTPAKAVEERNELKRRIRKTKVQPSQQCRCKPNPKKLRADRYDSRTYYRAVAYAQDSAIKAGVELNRWHPHQLRHTAATEIRQRYSLDTARAFLGHRSLAIANTYAELDQQAATAVAAERG